MQTRTVEMLIGDWANDGHGKNQLVRLELSGDDVSDEALKLSLAAAEAAVGTKLEDLFPEKYNSLLEDTDFIAMLEAGFDISNVGASKPPTTPTVWYYVSEDAVRKASKLGYKDLDDVGEWDAVKLLMGFFGFAISNFSYREIAPELLIGKGGLAESFGYGLFQ